MVRNAFRDPQPRSRTEPRARPRPRRSQSARAGARPGAAAGRARSADLAAPLGQQPEPDAVTRRHVARRVLRAERHAVAPGPERMLQVESPAEAQPLVSGGGLERHLPPHLPPPPLHAPLEPDRVRARLRLAP